MELPSPTGRTINQRIVLVTPPRDLALTHIFHGGVSRYPSDANRTVPAGRKPVLEHLPQIAITAQPP
eukprot:11449255-Alexandrium_andersonii.AAC.1